MTGSIDRTFERRLRKREPLLGTVLSLPSPEIAELCAGAGFDWLFIDMEHGLIEFADAQRMIQAAGPCPCIVRVPMNEAIWVGKALDTGAAGVIAPHVSTAAEAKRLVRAGKYPPAGARSIGVARAQGFGARVQDSVDGDNDAVLLVPQAEHIEAARNIGEIVATPGVDAVFIGPFDLSGSLAKPGRIGDAEVQAAMATIRDGCAAARIACGVFVVDAESARRAIGEGYSLVCVSSEVLLLRRAAGDVLREARTGGTRGQAQ
jgi:2-dehydro-3-deoxyglucarate aldolase/4-hydroxy-2-oxoheptanedioate aldolase